jgi:hypothetical protein
MAPGVLFCRKSNVSIPSKQQAGSLPQRGPPAAVAVCCKREKCKRILMITVLLYAIMLGYFILSQHPAFLQGPMFAPFLMTNIKNFFVLV